MTKYLIVNADDFGLSPKVNDAIIQAHRYGIVTSATLMANMPGFQHAVGLARQHKSLGVGLHVNLSSGKPLSPVHSVPSLVGPKGIFSNRRAEWREEDIEREMRRQFERLVSAGIRPSHLDSHHHIHLEVPSVYASMNRLAKEKRIPVRLHPWSQCPDASPRTNRLIMDTYERDDGTGRLLEHIETLGEGTTEVMCHPASAEGEMLALTASRVREAIARHAIHLIDFRQLPVADDAPSHSHSHSHSHSESLLPPEPRPCSSGQLAVGTVLPRRRKSRIKRKLPGKVKSRRRMRSGSTKKRRAARQR